MVKAGAEVFDGAGVNKDVAGFAALGVSATCVVGWKALVKAGAGAGVGAELCGGAGVNRDAAGV